MSQWLSKMLDRVSNYLAPRKGLLPLIGILLIVANFIVQFLPLGWFADKNILLHLGLVVTIFGFMLAQAL